MTGLVLSRERVSWLLERGGFVKIDGLREPDHAAVAASAGADAIGFIFAPARRQVTPDVARRCIEAARQASPDRQIIAVGVFVDADTGEIDAVARETGLDLVQLHGDETPDVVGTLHVPAIKALRPRPGATGATVLAEIERFRSASVPPIAFLIDGFSERGAGGTGARADWNLVASIGRDAGVILAGGLDPENVAAAIGQVRPLGVDVSSGVEIAGVKDAGRITAFVQAARAAFRQQVSA